MKAIFSPAVALMLRLPNEQKLPLLTAMFLLPLALLYYETSDHVSPVLGAWIAGGVLVAIYLMASFYIQANEGWARVIDPFKRLAEGDLTGQVDAAGLGGHFGLFLRLLGDINRSLGDIVAQVRSSSHSVALSAKEIAVGNMHLSRRTEQQASTLGETASGMEQLAATVSQSADNCRLASQQAQSADTVARDGAQRVHGVVQGMGRIDQSSKRMAEIVGVIEGITLQTNILALNAAVEAAQAGEQGRGFAVVAGEVRALAWRSAAAAKEIKALIEESMAQVSDGSRQAEAAGKVIDEIVASVHRGNELVGEIAVASAEQSSGLREINKAIVQLESVTQQNAALVEEAAAKSLSLQQEADRLTRIVARFRIAGDAGLRAAVPTPSLLPTGDPGGGFRAPLAEHHARPAAHAGREWKES
jgi:methyl-accepting chemotaxis protein